MPTTEMRLHHLAFRTRDLAALESFYAEVLALPVLRRSDRSVWLDAEGTILMLERSEPDEPTSDPRSMDLVCFGVTPGFLARLAEVAIEGRTDSTLYFQDPDGRRIGVSAYPDTLGDVLSFGSRQRGSAR